MVKNTPKSVEISKIVIIKIVSLINKNQREEKLFRPKNEPNMY